MNFESICQSLTRENPIILNFIIIFYTIIWTILDIKIVEKLLDLEVDKKKKTIWFFANIIVISICKILLPSLIYKIVTLAIFPILTNIILKIDIAKCLTVQLIDYIIVFLIEAIFTKNLADFIGIDSYFKEMNIPLYRLIMVGIILTVKYIAYRIFKWKNIIINFPQKLNGKRKTLIIASSIIGICVITVKSIELIICDDVFHYSIFILDTISILIVFIASMKYIMQIPIVDKKSIEIEKLKYQNENLKELYDSVRAFRHDFGNIVQAFGGYIRTKNVEALTNMYEDLLEECQDNIRLEALDPNVINNPAIYNILNQKYQKAREENIKMSIEIFADLEKIKIKTYEFARVLGILLDNAIDAAKLGNIKEIELKIAEEVHNNRNIIIVKNTYDNKKIEIDRLFEKGYTTKQDDNKCHGLGLWEVRKILNKNDNLNLFTTVEGAFFKQQLEVYKTA